MPWGFAAAAVGTVAASTISSNASKKAANAQSASAQAGIDQTTDQFNQVKELLSPYVTAGNQSLAAQQNLLGLNGNDAQQTAINGIKTGSQYNELLKQGENSILQNASATGGLRGGNTQAALAQYSPQLLNSLIGQQYTNLGGMTALGQNAAAGTGNAGMQSAQSINALLQQQGAAQAGGALAQGKATAGMINGLTSAFGSYAGYGGGF